MSIDLFNKSSSTEKIYPFNRRLSFGVFILARRGFTKEQISARLAMDLDQVDQILAVNRVRDGVVKKLVERLSDYVCKMAIFLVHARMVNIFWPFINRDILNRNID